MKKLVLALIFGFTLTGLVFAQNPGPNQSPNNDTGNYLPPNYLEEALLKVGKTLIDDLPKNKTIFVLSVASRDPDMAAFAIQELEFQLVDSKAFTVIDRATLDKIQPELISGFSADFDDYSAVSIGKVLGANIVITGSVYDSGTSQRLIIRALDVQTNQIITIARGLF